MQVDTAILPSLMEITNMEEYQLLQKMKKIGKLFNTKTLE